jgi:hypothetical protein
VKARHLILISTVAFASATAATLIPRVDTAFAQEGFIVNPWETHSPSPSDTPSSTGANSFEPHDEPIEVIDPFAPEPAPKLEPSSKNTSDQAPKNTKDSAAKNPEAVRANRVRPPKPTGRGESAGRGESPPVPATEAASEARASDTERAGGWVAPAIELADPWANKPNYARSFESFIVDPWQSS